VWVLCALITPLEIEEGRLLDVPDPSHVVAAGARPPPAGSQIDCDLPVRKFRKRVTERLMTIPSIGPVGTALATSMIDGHQFRSDR